MTPGITPLGADPAAVYEDNGFHTRISRLEKQHKAAEDVVAVLYERISALEALTRKPPPRLTDWQMREDAARAQAEAPADLYAPLRTNTGPLIRLTALARRMLDPDDLGHAVTEEVRNLAREALGLSRVETKG